MQLETYRQYDVDHVPGTIIGLHPIKKFDSLEAAQAVTKDWDEEGRGMDEMEARGGPCYHFRIIRPGAAFADEIPF